MTDTPTTPSPQAMRLAEQIDQFLDGRELGCCVSVAELARFIEPTLSDIRRQNDRLKEALATKAESEKGLFDQLRMREEQLEALMNRWTVRKGAPVPPASHEYWVWVDSDFNAHYVDAPHDQPPPWPDSARKALAEQGNKT